MGLRDGSPARQAHAGITPDLVRLSAGMEQMGNIIAELEQALGHA